MTLSWPETGLSDFPSVAIIAENYGWQDVRHGGFFAILGISPLKPA